MDRYVTGAVMHRLREDRNMTREAARFRIDRVTKFYAYCNRHGLFQMKPWRDRTEDDSAK